MLAASRPIETGHGWPDVSPLAQTRFSERGRTLQRALNDVGGGETLFERNGDNFASGPFHFFAARDEVRPVGSLRQNVGQYGGDQLARRIFVENGNSVHSFEVQGKRNTLALLKYRTAGALQALHTVVGV